MCKGIWRASKSYTRLARSVNQKNYFYFPCHVDKKKKKKVLSILFSCNFSGMMLMYWIHSPACNLQQGHTTCLRPTFNNLPKIYAAVDACSSWKEDTTSILFHTLSQTRSAPFSESQAWHWSLTTLLYCMKNH